MVIFAFLTLVFMLWLSSYMDWRVNIQKTGKDNVVETYGSNLADKLFLAAQVNPGYSDEIVVGDDIQGIEFDVYLEPGSLVIVANNNNYYFDIPCLYVAACNYGSDKFPMDNKRLEINNTNHEVFVNILDPTIPDTYDCTPVCDSANRENDPPCKSLC